MNIVFVYYISALFVYLGLLVFIRAGCVRALLQDVVHVVRVIIIGGIL